MSFSIIVGIFIMIFYLIFLLHRSIFIQGRYRFGEGLNIDVTSGKGDIKERANKKMQGNSVC